jgi:hypothetical protein
VSVCNLGGEGLRPLVDALPGNTALRRLRCRFNDVSPPFASSLVAAVRANTSLRTLEANNGEVWLFGERHGPNPELAEAEALVAARA